MASETVTLTIESEEDADEITLPRSLVDMLSQSDDETATEVVGDVAMMGFAQRIHGAVHHSESEPSEEVIELDEHMMDLFEDRFGKSFEDLVGHSH